MSKVAPLVRPSSNSGVRRAINVITSENASLINHLSPSAAAAVIVQLYTIATLQGNAVYLKLGRFSDVAVFVCIQFGTCAICTCASIS